MQRQRESWNDLSLFQKIEIMQGLASFPAMTAMLLLRRRLGHRFLRPGALLAMPALMFLVAEFARETDYPEALQLFAGFVLISGLAERRRRKKEFERGIFQHSHYIGDSVLELRWLPEFLKRKRRVARFIDPLFWGGLGLVVFQVSPALGGWMMFSAGCVHVFEDAVHRQEKERDMDTIDSVIEADINGECIDRLSGTRPERFARGDGIPTGHGPDIEESIRRRPQQGQ